MLHLPVPAAAHPDLARFFEDVRVVTPISRAEVLPNGRTMLFLRLFPGGQGGDLSVAGPRTRALYKDVTGVAQMVRFQFRPGWSAHLLGVNLSELADRTVPLREIWGQAGMDLLDGLMAADSTLAMATQVAQAVTVRTAQATESASTRLARGAVQLLEQGQTRVDAVAGRLGVTPRHLRRAFTESVGIGPRDFARTVRLQRAVRMAATGSPNWARIAADAGYYDQAHLIAEFRALLGLTPSAFVQRARGQGESDHPQPVCDFAAMNGLRR